MIFDPINEILTGMTKNVTDWQLVKVVLAMGHQFMSHEPPVCKKSACGQTTLENQQCGRWIVPKVSDDSEKHAFAIRDHLQCLHLWEALLLLFIQRKMRVLIFIVVSHCLFINDEKMLKSQQRVRNFTPTHFDVDSYPNRWHDVNLSKNRLIDLVLTFHARILFSYPSIE